MALLMFRVDLSDSTTPAETTPYKQAWRPWALVILGFCQGNNNTKSAGNGRCILLSRGLRVWDFEREDIPGSTRIWRKDGDKEGKG